MTSRVSFSPSSHLAQLTAGPVPIRSNEEVCRANKFRFKFSFFGLIMCLLTNVLLATTSVIVKSLSSSPLQKIFGRTCFQFFILLPIVTYRDQKKIVNFFGPSGYLKLLILRGLVGSSTSICLYFAITKLPVGDAVALSFMSTVLTGIISYFCLNEAFTWLDRCFAALSLLGVSLISKPQFIFGQLSQVADDERGAGILFSIASAILIALSLTLVRSLKCLSVILNTFYFSFFGVILPLLISSFQTNVFNLPCLGEIPLILLHGFLGLSSQVCMAIALRYEKAVTFAVCRSSQIIIVFMFQILVLKDQTDSFSIGGSTLIVISSVGIAIRRYYEENLEQGQVIPVISEEVLVAS